MKMSQTVGKVLVYSSISQCMHAKSLPMNTELRRVGTCIERERGCAASANVLKCEK